MWLMRAVVDVGQLLCDRAYRKIFDDEEWTELYRNFRNMRKIRDISLNPHIALSIIVKPFNKRPPIYPETDFASENGATTCR